jgi:integrase
MGYIEKRGPGRWRARYRSPDGRERSKTFDRRVDADRFLAEMAVAKNRGAWVDPRAGRMPFSEWAAECYAARIDLRESSRARDEGYLRLHVLPHFGSIPLSRIERRAVQGWVTILGDKGLAPATVRACHRLLSGMLAEAVEARLIGESPCRGIKLPRVGRVEQRFLTALEVERLACEIDPQFSTLIYAGAYLGARWGELVGLKRERVNLLKRQVTIVGTLEEVGGRLRYVEETKTSASRRLVTIPPFLCDLLSTLLGNQVSTRGNGSEFVFVTPNGAFLRRSNFRRGHFKPALGRADLDPGFRFHDLRHTCAALMIEQGAHPMEVKARLGHASIKTTLDRYGHLMPTLGGRLDDALDQAHRAAKSNVSRPVRGLEVVEIEAADVINAS